MSKPLPPEKIDVYGDSGVESDAFVALSVAVENNTGQRLFNPRAPQSERLLNLADIHGVDRVIDAMAEVRRIAGRRMMLNELVNGVENSLALHLDVREVRRQEAEERERAEFQKLVARTKEEQQRLRETGYEGPWPWESYDDMRQQLP